jgi:salicylate hydroxylase
LQGVRSFFAPALKLKWSGWTAFRAVYDYSLVDDIPNIPQDSTHWWGPETTFFASRLGKTRDGKNLFTVVGGVQDDPTNSKATTGLARWDQEANVTIFKELYSVSMLTYYYHGGK